MKTPTLLLPKLGVLKVGNKSFSYNDIKKGLVGIGEFGLDSNWYGGRVQNLGVTEEGFLLCIENDQVIGLYIPDLERINADGKNLLRMEGLLEFDETFPDGITPEEYKKEMQKPLSQDEVNVLKDEIKENNTTDEVKEEVTAKLNEIVNARIKNRRNQANQVAQSEPAQPQPQPEPAPETPVAPNEQAPAPEETTQP